MMIMFEKKCQRNLDRTRCINMGNNEFAKQMRWTSISQYDSGKAGMSVASIECHGRMAWEGVFDSSILGSICLTIHNPEAQPSQ